MIKNQLHNPPNAPPHPLISALADVLLWLDAHDTNKNPDNANTLTGGREIGVKAQPQTNGIEHD